MANPMTLHELNPVKGWHDNLNALDKQAALASSDVNTVAPKGGMVAHLYPTTGADKGKLALGAPAPASGICPMPVFLFSSMRNFATVADNGQLITGGEVDVANGLVACGHYELETTEYVGTPGTGTLLTGATGGSLGKIEATGIIDGALTIVGCVSDGVVTPKRGDGENRLRFWSTFIPLFGPESAASSSSSGTSSSSSSS
jgi:hypothetical protein